MTTLAEHKAKEHSRTPFSAYLREMVYGGVDGIITTFAIVAGFSGATLSHEATTQLSFLVVLLFGFANLFADGVSMGLGNFLSIRSDQDLYRAQEKKERHEVRTNSPMEKAETIEILRNKGFSETDALALTEIYQRNEDYWVDFMMKYELEMQDSTGENPALSGTATFFSFIIFGFIPIAPFLFFATYDAQTVFIISSAGTLLALIMLGLLKWRVVGSGFWKSILEIVLVGSVAAFVAFFVGTFFAI